MKTFFMRAPFSLLLLLFSLIIGNNCIAQTKDLPKADNSIHDRMYDLLQKSKNISLPAETAEMLLTINKNKPYKEKIIYSQTNMLKVLYNTALSKADRKFFGNQLLMNNTDKLVAIHAEIKKVMRRL